MTGCEHRTFVLVTGITETSGQALAWLSMQTTEPHAENKTTNRTLGHRNMLKIQSRSAKKIWTWIVLS